ncbi:type VI secretion system Vgr family protein [Candidatus Gromoviella agglomerans]|uniref:type VI secretion system Vgr family protein n=1 Tax=Candidatus Gromoviella agglomerans TaxID=2806609 RepID=UPI001E447FA9|nr:type VI secretion system tip protein TssI/VgrG [Candidatus Gromoviella agglomerans]UFX98463.1 Type VI secretion system VgrG family protein [Candidatus Gromoviella agglomerans]
MKNTCNNSKLYDTFMSNKMLFCMYIELTLKIDEKEHKLQRMVVIDEVSTCFRIVTEFSERHDFVDMLLSPGKEVRIDVELSKEYKYKRYYHGVIEKLTRKVTHRYRVDEDGKVANFEVVIRPKLWLLSQTNSYRVFQKKTTSEILEKVLREDHHIEFENRAVATTDSQIHSTYIQYNESDLNFVCRLLEEEGIFFYSEQSKDKELIVIADKIPDEDVDRCDFYNIDHAQAFDLNKITFIAMEHKLIPKSNKVLQFKYDVPVVDEGFYESVASKRYGDRVFDYTSMDSKSQEYAEKLSDIQDSAHKIFYGNTTYISLAAGKRIKVRKHTIDEFNNDYFVTSCEQIFSSQENDELPYSATFVGVHKDTHFRPKLLTPRPIVPGQETAIVIGRKGDVPGALYTNENGDVKIRFHWQSVKDEDETITAWTRVAHNAAGHRSGSFHMPRIGQEVLVTFIHGNPNAPIIVGGVPNGANKVKYVSDGQHEVEYWIAQIDPADSENVNEIKFVNKVGEDMVGIYSHRDLSIETKTGKIEIHAVKEMKLCSDTLIEIDAPSIIISADKIEIRGRDPKVEVDEIRINGNLIDIKSQDTRFDFKKFVARLDDAEVRSENLRIHSDDGSLELHLNNVEVHANAEISLEAPDVKIKADASIHIEADGETSIKASMIKLN